MSVPEKLQMLVGNWTGTSRLVRPWLSPPDAESESTASVSAVARGNFVTIEYTWIVDDEPQEGVLRGDAAFEIAMFNISPDGEETPAFENRYMRRA
jgi:hypothetical protein